MVEKLTDTLFHLGLIVLYRCHRHRHALHHKSRHLLKPDQAIISDHLYRVANVRFNNRLSPPRFPSPWSHFAADLTSVEGQGSKTSVAADSRFHSEYSPIVFDRGRFLKDAADNIFNRAGSNGDENFWRFSIILLFVGFLVVFVAIWVPRKENSSPRNSWS